MIRESKEYGLLLSAPMVRATLSGIKHVTRRIPSMRNTLIDGKPWGKSNCKWKDVERQIRTKTGISISHDGNLWVSCFRCDQHHSISPIYQPGDVVYFRETWTSGYCDGGWGTIFSADNTFVLGKRKHDKGPHFHAKEMGTHVKWRTSMFLPRWAARLVRPVISSRFEYLQDITEEEAIAEGMREPSLRELHPTLAQAAWSELQVFSRLWDALNADRDGGIYAWKENPLEITLEFGLENIQ